MNYLIIYVYFANYSFSVIDYIKSIIATKKYSFHRCNLRKGENVNWIEKLDSIADGWFAEVNGVIRRWKKGSRTLKLCLVRKNSPILEQYQELFEYEIRDSFRTEAFRIKSLW